MTNEQKFFGELTEYGRKYIALFSGVDCNTGEPELCLKVDCENCLLLKGQGDCHKRFTDWLKQEYKESVNLTDFERELLKRALKAEYQYISRDESNKLFAYKYKPQKEFHTWVGGLNGDMYDLNLFKDDFPFVKWEDDEPYSIEDLLKGEE